MVVGMYCIYDIKTCVFHPPMFCHNDDHAIRVCHQVGQQGKQIFAEYPEDFKLFCVGSFDDATGQIKSLPSPRYVANILDLFRGDKDENSNQKT